MLKHINVQSLINLRKTANRGTLREVTLILSLKKIDNMNWLKSRCNRDNFWNLMFCVGMSVGFAVSELFDSVLLLLFAIFILPRILTMFNKVTYTADGVFVNKQSESLAQNLPTKFNLVLFANIGFTAFIFVPCFMFNGFILLNLTITTFIAFLLFIPTMYFIYKNCPVSILFHKQAWCKAVTGITPMSKAELSQRRTLADDSYRRFAGMEYSYLSTNIHHKK